MNSSFYSNRLQQIKFFVNDEEKTVHVSNMAPECTLNEYLREEIFLTGTKRMCLEGGCGSCIVSVTKKHPTSGKELTCSVNSCLVSVFSCDGWKIKTIEGIGNSLNGYHVIQKTLAENHGTQCGFCTPGMIMNMYTLLKSNPNLTMEEVENSFSGNICRCTGYRPILQAFKTFCVDGCENGKTNDIEDLEKCGSISNGTCRKRCAKFGANVESVLFNFECPRWFKAVTIEEIFAIFDKEPNASYRLVAGNTAKGIYKYTNTPSIYVDITNVKELLSYNIKSSCFEIGAGTALKDAIDIFNKMGNEHKKFQYLTKIADHISLIANVPVRNVGTLGGNLSIKHDHHEFPSDIFLIFETVGAKITIIGRFKEEITLRVQDYLNYDMRHRIIKSVVFMEFDDSDKFGSYKIMPRSQNALGLLNAGFHLKLENNVVKNAAIVFGRINSNFVHATKAEKFLIDKPIFNNDTLQRAFKILDEELTPVAKFADPSPIFRKKLAISLFYKFILSIAPDKAISERNRSGRLHLFRPVSLGTQEYATNKALYPVTEPVRKTEGLPQTTGEAEYIIDMPDLPNQLYAAFVLAKAPPGSTIRKINYTKALNLKGAVAFFDKNDIPGENTFMPSSLYPQNEELFCSGVVQFFSQPVGIMVCKTQKLAELAAELVEITYDLAATKPLLNVRDVLSVGVGATDRITKAFCIEAATKGDDVRRVIRGEFDVGHQYHFHLETQCCNVVPKEDGFDMYPATQHMDHTNAAAAALLNLPANKFNIYVRRLGGAFGAKISRNTICSNAALLACYKLGKPVKMWLPLHVNMQIVGKRLPCSVNYEAGLNAQGKIQYMNMEFYSDYGVGCNEPVTYFAYDAMLKQTYDLATWNVGIYSVRTDTPAGTWCRAPATTESIGAVEAIMDHIAYQLGKDPLEVRLLNMDPKRAEHLPSYVQELLSWADIETRKDEIALFNKQNRWIKKGMSIVPTVYNLLSFAHWSVIVSIYHVDGTVAVAHAGIEIGQGINTKVIQVCAQALGIPMEKVSVKPSNNLVSPNSMFTGASITSEGICYGVLKACEMLLERIAPTKATLAKTTWEEVIHQCRADEVNLTAQYLASKNSPDLAPYQVHLVCATEVEVDILTGKHLVKRVDLLEDVGESTSPAIDVGQVEGAFTMGLGYWTSEKIVMSAEGEVLTNNTLTYTVPGAKDIPIDLRVKFSKCYPNRVGVLKSKAVGEPPMISAVSVPLAIRQAIASARSDINEEKWYKISGPSTVEDNFLHSLHDYKYYTL